MPAQPNVTPLFEDNPVPRAEEATTSGPNPTSAPENAFRHTIETGESLYSIARRYDVSTSAIVSANDLAAPDQIYVGQKIVIPGRPELLTARASDTETSLSEAQPEQAAAATPEDRPVAETPANDETEVQTAAIGDTKVTTAGNFRWPVQGRVIVDFENSRETGINIEAPEGASVRAAENGTVIYVGDDVEGYGNLVLVRHSNGYVTAYAHLRDVTVSRDDVIDRGTQVGTVGMSGSVSRPQLHFELRQGASPVDPVPQLAG